MFHAHVRPLPCVRLSHSLHCAEKQQSQAVRPQTERHARRRVAVAGIRRSCALRATDQDTPGAGSTSSDEAADDDGVSFVPRRKARAKGKVQPKVKVLTPAVDAALDAPPTEAGQAETAALLALAGVFTAILGEGLMVAAAGFMSDDMDAWVQATVLPLFTPTLLLFLLGSSSYGALTWL